MPVEQTALRTARVRPSSVANRPPPPSCLRSPCHDHATLAEYKHQRAFHEDALSVTFQTLLSDVTRPHGWTLIAHAVEIEKVIDATDHQIDQVVYRLYGLTPDEVAIVEAATG